MKSFKKFSVSYSKKFANGSFASMTFESGREIDVPENVDDIEKFEGELFADVYEATIEDLKLILKQDQVARSIFTDIKDAIRAEKRVKDAKKKLKE